MLRRLVVCLDGTWNTYKDHTNVSRLHAYVPNCRVPLDYVDIRSRRLLESRRFLNDLIVALRRRP